jgi:hypothetical protein
LIIDIIKLSHLLMQQTLPNAQDPLAVPLSWLQIPAVAQMPITPLGDEQLS